ncbi:MAG: hypothetical protein QM765_28435 [Myxococcales bacterium]
MSDTKWSALSWHIPGCATDRMEWPDGFRDLWLVGSVLVVNTFRDLLFLDASDPREARAAAPTPDAVRPDGAHALERLGHAAGLLL